MTNTQEATSDQDPLGWRETVAQGHFIRKSDSARFPIPGELNVALTAVQITAAFALLASASHAKSLWVTGLLAVMFAFIMQLEFCLGHEAVHGKLHARSNVNDGLGILLFSLGDDATAFPRYLQFLNSVNRGRIRRDLLVTAIIWTAASLLLHLRFSAVEICYGLFAFCWASQQYLYHLRTPRHAVLGTLDLHIWRPLELLYLHFNYHLTHHAAAWVPWIYLPKIAAEQPTRCFLSAYVDQWRPPPPLEKRWPPSFQASGPLPPRSDLESVAGGHQGD